MLRDSHINIRPSLPLQPLCQVHTGEVADRSMAGSGPLRSDCIFNNHIWNYCLLCVHISVNKHAITASARVCGTTVPCPPTLCSACVAWSEVIWQEKAPPFKGSERTSYWRHAHFTKGKSQRGVFSVIGQTPVYGKWILSELMRKVCVCGGGGGFWKFSQRFHQPFVHFSPWYQVCEHERFST